MKVLIISDTHAQDDIFLTLLAKERDFDVLLHAGDFEGSELVYQELAGVPFIMWQAITTFSPMRRTSGSSNYAGSASS